MVILSAAEYQAQLTACEGHDEYHDNRFAVVAGLLVEVVEYLDNKKGNVCFVHVTEVDGVYSATDGDALKEQANDAPKAIYLHSSTAEANAHFVQLIQGRLAEAYAR